MLPTAEFNASNETDDWYACEYNVQAPRVSRRFKRRRAKFRSAKRTIQENETRFEKRVSTNSITRVYRYERRRPDVERERERERERESVGGYFGR